MGVLDLPRAAGTLFGAALVLAGFIGGPAISAAAQGASSSTQEQQLLEAGKEALTRGDYEAAITAFQKLAAAAPNVAEVHANLGAVYYFSGHFEDAVRECRRALEIKPSLRRTGYFLDLSLAESGRCPEALPRLNRDYGSADDPHLKRQMGVDAARCSMEMNRPEDSARLMLSLIREFPDDPDVLYLASHIFSDISTQTSQQLLATAPGSFQAHRFNAEVLEAQGKLKDAIDEYRKVLEMNPHLDGIHYEIGRLLLATVKGDAGVDEAQAEFRKELDINPRSAPSEYELGNLAWQAKDWDKATRLFKKAAELDPRMSAAWLGLGQSLSSAGHYEQAVEPLQRAVKLDPQNPDAHYRLAFVLRHLGREKEAEQELAAYRQAEQDQLKTSTRIRRGMTGMGSQTSEDAPHR